MPSRPKQLWATRIGIVYGRPRTRSPDDSLRSSRSGPHNPGFFPLSVSATTEREHGDLMDRSGKDHFDKPSPPASSGKATKRAADNPGDFLDDMDSSKDHDADFSSDADFIKHIAVAAMMDVAGVDFKALQTGLSVVTVPSDAAVDVYAAVQRIVIDMAFAGNVSRTAGVKRNKKIDGSSDTAGILMSGTDSDDADLALFWQAGYAAILGLGLGHNLPPAMKKLADRHYQLPGLSAFVIGLTIFAVTGSKAPVDPDVCAQADMSRLMLSIRRGMTADLCVDRLKRIQAARGIPNADADAPVDLPTAVSIGDAAKDVVTKTSVMADFGDAKAWGMQLASDFGIFPPASCLVMKWTRASCCPGLPAAERPRLRGRWPPSVAST